MYDVTSEVDSATAIVITRLWILSKNDRCDLIITAARMGYFRDS